MQTASLCGDVVFSLCRRVESRWNHIALDASLPRKAALSVGWNVGFRFATLLAMTTGRVTVLLLFTISWPLVVVHTDINPELPLPSLPSCNSIKVIGELAAVDHGHVRDAP